MVSIIGPNGSGKSTTLNLVSGVLRPDSGTIALRGVSVGGRAPEYLAAQGIARTFQNGRVFGSLSVAQNVEAGLYVSTTALRPLRRFSGIPVLTWISLLAELAIAVLPTPAARRELRTIRPAVNGELRQVLRSVPAVARRGRVYPVLRQPPPDRDRQGSGLQDLRCSCWTSRLRGMNQTETAEVLAQLVALKSSGQTDPAGQSTSSTWSARCPIGYW